MNIAHIFRSLLRTPGFTAVAVLTLALGIGANAAIFSTVDAVLLRALPYPEPEQLVTLWVDARSRDMPQTEWTNAADFATWQREAKTIRAMSAVTGWGPTLTGTGEPEQIAGVQATHGFFDTVGVQPVLGRGFTAEEDVPNAPRVVVISANLWEQRFRSDPGVIGSAIVLGGEPFTVIGVMPRGFQTPLLPASDLWTPRRDDPNQGRGGFYLRVLARLADGATIEQAQAEMAQIMGAIAERNPDTNEGLGAYVQPLRETLTGNVRTQLLVLLGATVLVLLIACANLANLLLTRATGRARELAVRAALGAGRGQLIGQLLAESLLLGALGAAAGIALAYGAAGWLAAALPDGVSALATPRIDARVLGYATALGLLSALAFGSAPALAATRLALAGTLRDGDRGSSGGRTAQRLRAVLVGGNFALALALAIGAGLFLKSLDRLVATDLGFRPERLLTFTMALPQTAYPQPENVRGFHGTLLERLRALPGVRSAALTSTLPLGGTNTDASFFIEERADDPAKPLRAWYSIASDGYFETLGIRIRRGRALNAQDDATAPTRIVVNQVFANEFFPGVDPIGKRIGTGPRDEPTWWEIAGVADDVRFFGVGIAQTPSLYISIAQRPARSFFVALRTSGEPATLVAAARRAIADIDPALPIANVQTMDELVDASLGTQKLVSTLVGAFALLALALAGIGVYGVVAYAVSLRSRELGVRMALGATRRKVVAHVLHGGLVLAASGMAVGIVLALALGRSVASLLYAVTPYDPLVFAGVTVVLLVVAVLASLVPAWRASRVDPMVALRYE